MAKTRKAHTDKTWPYFGSVMISEASLATISMVASLAALSCDDTTWRALSVTWLRTTESHGSSGPPYKTLVTWKQKLLQILITEDEQTSIYNSVTYTARISLNPPTNSAPGLLWIRKTFFPFYITIRKICSSHMVDRSLVVPYASYDFLEAKAWKDCFWDECHISDEWTIRGGIRQWYGYFPSVCDYISLPHFNYNISTWKSHFCLTFIHFPLSRLSWKISHTLDLIMAKAFTLVVKA